MHTLNHHSVPSHSPLFYIPSIHILLPQDIEYKYIIEKNQTGVRLRSEGVGLRTSKGRGWLRRVVMADRYDPYMQNTFTFPHFHTSTLPHSYHHPHPLFISSSGYGACNYDISGYGVCNVLPTRYCCPVVCVDWGLTHATRTRLIWCGRPAK